ncbi:DUF5677 domain-containing protein [Moritella sp.]|uniref:DUF5677 domain-containing protein n=1 Tax=Moritella sp. TaxID=78556 RepID=UPI001D1D0F5F|nr:DUF5677 domain-containing protein [Moritella sp.]MCJ8350890.1 DUF5677 domain-containing protein [Moritella sp.]NQZ40424.1 hypothetical protein [Moritella sp.]
MQQVLKNTIDYSTDKAVLFQFESRSKLAAYSMGIYCTLIELSESFHTLIQSQNYTGSLSIYRSFIENFVDLKNLKLNGFYVNQLDHGSYEQEKRMLKAAKQGNVYLTSIAKYADDKTPKIEAEIKLLKESNEFKLCKNIYEKFCLAGMEQEYRGLYPTLSAESHCSLDAIFSRHFEYDPANNKVNLVIHSKDKDNDYEIYIANLANYLITAGILVANILEGQQLNEFVLKKEEIISALA